MADQQWERQQAAEIVETFLEAELVADEIVTDVTRLRERDELLSALDLILSRRRVRRSRDSVQRSYQSLSPAGSVSVIASSDSDIPVSDP